MIEIQHVTKRFERTKALNDVTLSIPKGKVFGLLRTGGCADRILLSISGEEADFYYSLPVRKGTIFWSRYVHGGADI